MFDTIILQEFDQIYVSVGQNLQYSYDVTIFEQIIFLKLTEVVIFHTR